MADNETIADIIAEKRARADELEASSYKPHQFLRERIAELRQEADRLEAARERERENYDAKIADLQSRVKLWTDRSAELVKKCDEQHAKLKQVGHAAKLREAVFEAKREIDEYRDDGVSIIERMTNDPPDYTCLRDSIIKIYEIVDAALAAPPRNCDAMDWRTAWKIWREKFHPETPVGYSAVVKGTEAFMDWFTDSATEKEGDTDADK